MDTSASPTRSRARRRSGQVTARRLAQLGPDAAAMRASVSRWALARGRRVGFDALTVILAAKASLGGPLHRWTEDDIWQLWWIELSQWCAVRGLAVPDGLVPTMLTLLDHLDDTGTFAPGSDERDDLEDALEASGALWRHAPASAG